MKATFCGGKYDGQTMTIEEIIRECPVIRYTDNPYTRVELRNKPVVDGYYPPMWNGGELRYETPEVYRSMCI